MTRRRPGSNIDSTKHDEDIAERMIGGARMDRRGPAKSVEREGTANDHPDDDDDPSERPPPRPKGR
jgi:hypothetical protein